MAVDSKGKQLPKGITQRKDGTYQARYMFEGKRITIYDKELKPLEKKLRDAIYEVEHGIHARPEKIVLDAWFKTWIKEYKLHTVKENTIKTYKIMYDQHIKKKLGRKKLKDIRSEHIQTLLNGMARAKYSNSSIELTSIILGSALKQAMKNGIITANPMFAVDIPRKKEKKEVHVLTRKEQEMFMKHVKGTEYELLFSLALSTGMRIGEISGLEWENVDLKKNVIKIRKTLIHQGTKNCALDSPKTLSSIRDVPLLPEVVQGLKDWRKVQMELKLSLGDKWKPVKGIENLVFTKEAGLPMNEGRVKDVIKRFVREIRAREAQEAEQENREPHEMKDFTPHTLRHTFATRALENGIPPKVVQDILGHGSITMTLDLYTHALPETKQEEVQKIAHLI